MDVRLKPLGRAGCAGTVFSLGLLPVLLRRQESRFPATLTEEGMVLRSGRQIPWAAFTRVRATDVLLNQRYQHTLYELWYAGGRVHFPSHRIENFEPVVAFIRAHVRPDVSASH